MTEEPARSSEVTRERILALLSGGELEVQGLLPWSSNYTFLVLVSDGALSIPAVYKPCAGERPLWDFASASLCRREVAAYVLSEQLGWPAVPPVVLRDGPHGPGSVQLFVNADHETHYFSLRESGQFDECLESIALFDIVANNADRKGGHCLLGTDGQVWAIDHGLTFHSEYKVRTIIWDYSGRRIPDDRLAELRAVSDRLQRGHPLFESLAQLLSIQEIHALRARLTRLVRAGTFPHPRPGRNVPYPLV